MDFIKVRSRGIIKFNKGGGQKKGIKLLEEK